MSTPDRAAQLAAQAVAVAELEAAGTVYRAALADSYGVRDQLAAAVRAAVAAGITEVEAARLAGVTRGTVRAWVGKPPAPRR